MSALAPHEASVEDRILKYLGTDDLDIKAAQATSLVASHNATARITGTEMFFDLAALQAEAGEDGQSFFETGEECLDDLEVARNHTWFPQDTEVLMTSRSAGLRVLESLVVADTVPTLDMVEAQYVSLVFYSHQIYLNACAHGALHGSRVSGAMSEASVLLLLTRLAHTNSLDGYFPLRSLFSQDRGGHHGPEADKWDVSVATKFNPEEPANLAHKIQVKTFEGKNSERRRYSEDISVVYVRNHLSLDPDELIDPWTIVDECGREANGQGRLTPILDERTGKLLEKIE